jgi:hypothetical protein
LNTLAEQTCFSFPLLHLIFSYYAEGCMASCMRDRIIGYFPLAERTCFSQGVKRILISDPYLSLSFTIKGTVCGINCFSQASGSSMAARRRSVAVAMDKRSVRALPGRLSALSVFQSKSVFYGATLLYGRAGCLAS